MGQQEVYDYLKENPMEWYTSRDLEKILHISIGSINESLRKLRDRKEINFKISVLNGRGKPQYLYNFKK
jgi:predicted transcriptional regulator